MRISWTLGGAAMALLLAGNAGAAENAAEALPEVSGVVVTASRVAAAQEVAPFAAEVWTREDFLRLGAQDLVQGLALAAGLDLSEAGMQGAGGGMGNRVMLRGMESSHTLVLVDGKRLAAEDTAELVNALALSRIPLSAVERVEILRGDAGALYGSDAMGGVISIVTRRPAGEEFSLGADTGSRVMELYARAGAGDETFRAAVSANFQKLRPFTFSGASNSALYGTRQNWSLRSEWAPAAGRRLGVDVDVMRDRLRMDYENGTYALDKVQRFRTEREGISADYSAEAGRHSLFFRAYYNELEKKSATWNRMGMTRISGAGPVPTVVAAPLPTAAAEDFDRARYETLALEARDAVRISENHRLTAGAEYRHSSYRGTRLGDAGASAGTVSFAGLTKESSEAGLDFYAGYLQEEWRVSDTVLLVPALRYDGASRFGGEWSPKLGATWRPSARFRLKGNVGRGYRAPSLSELYMDWDGLSMVAAAMPFLKEMTIKGNPALSPERSKNFDVAAEGETGAFSGRISYFRNDVKNLITTVTETSLNAMTHMPETMTARYENVDRARISGWETEAGWRLSSRWRLSGTVTFLSAEDAATGEALEYRGRRYGTARLSYENGGWAATFWSGFMRDYLYDGKRYDWHTWNVSVSRRFGERWTAFAAVTNLTDAELPEVAVAGRQWRIGAEVRI